MTLRFKLNLFIGLVLIVSNGIVALTLMDKQQALLAKNLHQQSEAITTLISQDAVKLVLLDSPQAASDIKQKLENLKDLQEITFLNNKQVPVLQLSNQPTDDDSIIEHTDLMFQGQVLGKVNLSFSGENKKQLQEELNLFLLKILIATLLIAITFSYFIDRIFSQRISALNSALKETAQSNDYSKRLSNHGQDEIGEAYKHFNMLVKNTERLTASLIDQINQDSLTRLYSRAFINNKISHILKQDDKKQTHALCYLGLDKFKIINDTFGHNIGDKFLVQVSRRLEKVVKPLEDAYLARAGSDEFILLLANTNEQQLNNILNRCIEVVTNFEMIERQQQLSVGLSIGAILFNQTNESKHSLIAAADAACYQAKQKGGNCSAIYWIDSDEYNSEREIVQWIHRIRNAIKDDKLKVYLQPIVSSDQFINPKPSYEALVRLQENDKVISPFAFIPTLERYGLMHEVDFYMIEQTLMLMSQHRDWLSDIKHISINLSGHTLNLPNSAKRIIKEIEDHNIPFSQVCFEITETAALSNLNHAQQFIEELKSYGCKFSLDDFGTGMASFDYLYNLPLNYLKIDGSFIKDITSDPVKEEMVTAMQKIAALMELETVAEFVENQEIIDRLNQIGITYHQGYHYSAPKPFAEFTAINNVS